MLVSLPCQGTEVVMNVEASTDAAVFRVYVSKMPEPALKPGDFVVVDNLDSNKVDSIRTNIESSGVFLIYWPQYAFHYSPIDHAGPNLKPA